MATTAQTPQRAAATPPLDDSPALTWLVTWIKGHRQIAGGIVAVLIVGGGLMWWNAISRKRTEAVASERLSQARLAVESRNYQLAASELSQVVENYSGTHSAEEAQLLLGEVRLSQGQGQQAIDLLKRFAPSAGRNFRAQAYGLLGAAYENAGQLKDAAEAYEAGAGSALYPFIRQQNLSDAGRAWVAAGDTARGLVDYRQIVKIDSTAAIVVEAQVRIGELTKGAGPL